MPPRPRALALCALLLAPLAVRAGSPDAPAAATPAAPAAPAPIPEPSCPPAPPVAHRFPAGEWLSFRLDVFGADVGTFEIWLEPPPASARPRVAYVGHGRARTSAFVSTNVARYEAFATALVGKGLAPLSWKEEVDDGPTHWVNEVEFGGAPGPLKLRATKDGEPVPLELSASRSGRDMLSAFLLLRGSPLKEGTPLCVEVFAGRKMWKMAGAVGPRETLEGPLGRHETVRLDLTSVRIDDARVVRTSKFWITDDAKRLPIAAITEMRGKVIRAQLVQVKGVKK